MKKKIFLTGASGFIGRNIREQLGKKYILFSPSHRELDLTSLEELSDYFEKHPVDIIIHAANIGGNKAEADFPNVVGYNLRIFFNLVHCVKYFREMIHLGSGAEYGIQSPIVEVKENEFGKRIPIDDYGFYKYICSKYIENANNIVNLRIFGIFGKHEEFRFRFISQAICKNLFGLPITINQNVKFTYVYIDDFIKIIDYFIHHKPKYKFYNIGPGKKVDLITLAKLVNRIADKPTKIIIRKKGLNKEYTCNSERLVNELKPFAFTPLEESIHKLYLWYKSQKSDIYPKELS